MNYTKFPLTIDQQIIKLEQRGLNFLHKEQAEHYLNKVQFHVDAAFLDGVGGYFFRDPEQIV